MASSDSVLSDDELQPLYVYYVGWFFFLLLVLFLFKYVSGSSVLSSHDSSKQPAVVTSEFKRFQRNFLLVYLLMMAADWLQGPYVYALYKHYGFDKGQIGVLFIVGFGASMIFGAFVGSMADKYGRKKMCLAFGVMYSASCITKHFGDYNTLLTGRLLGGISTSILFSSFESWMVHEHHEHAYPEEWMGLTFSLATSGNGMVAIGAGVLASIVRERFGPVAPFDASLAFLIIGSLIIAFTWPENTGDSSVDLHRTIYNAFIRMKSDSKVWLLGVIQSFFEGAMYIFVFMWTPALESTSPFPIYHGWIFASFMICTLIGSGIFSFYLERGAKVEKMALYMFAIAALSLLIPAFSSSHTVRLCAFFIFEVCVGLFWPSLGFLRSRYVPEEVRATVMNFFRIPLNFIVVLVLSHINDLPDLKVFSLCFAFLMIAFLCQIQLCKLVFQSTTQSGKRITTAATDEEMSEMEMASAPLTSSSH